MKLFRCGERYSRVNLVMLFILSLCTASWAAEPHAKVVASQFANEVTKEKYKETASPAEAPVFRWDFSKSNVVRTYAYEQEVRNNYDMGAAFGGGSHDTEQEISAKGLLSVKSKGDNTAELVLKDMQTSMKINMGKDKPETMEQKMPPVVVQGMKEDGSGPFGDSSEDMFLKLLFALPSKPLKVGESVDVPLQMPFNAMGSVLKVKGQSRITLTRYVTIDSRTCAQFDVDTDISELNVPSELKGEYKCSTRGTSVFYFDIANRFFVSGTSALVIQFSIDAPMPEMKISHEDASHMPEMPKRSKTSMISDNLIRVKLKE